jgi:hypothetical protein
MKESRNYRWQIEQKVICVNGSFSSEATKACDALPANGDIYTVRAIRQTREDVALLLKEVVNTREIYGKEPGFWQCRFEPFKSAEFFS